MGIYLPNMEMPCCCDECRFLDEYGDYPCCIITDEQRGYNFKTREKRMDNCPLVPVPPHGRLIDADAVVREIESFCGTHWTTMVIKRAPTIIPAEEG